MHQTIVNILGRDMVIICDTKAEWMMDHEDELDDYKNPLSSFQQEVTKIKFNANIVASKFLLSSGRKSDTS